MTNVKFDTWEEAIEFAHKNHKNNFQIIDAKTEKILYTTSGFDSSLENDTRLVVIEVLNYKPLLINKYLTSEELQNIDNIIDDDNLYIVNRKIIDENKQILIIKDEYFKSNKLIDFSEK